MGHRVPAVVLNLDIISFKPMIPWYRLALGLLALAALTTQFVYSARHHDLNPVNFFSYFTNLSNIIGGLVFVYTGLRRHATPATDWLRGAATIYLATTGIVYHLLLTNADTLGVLIPWVNLVLHLIMPLAAAVDWVARPPAHRLHFGQTWLWLVFPAAYLAYSLTRGAATGWYPYPFLNPAKVGGYGAVAAYSAGILLCLIGLIYGAMWLGNRQHRVLVGHGESGRAGGG